MKKFRVIPKMLNKLRGSDWFDKYLPCETTYKLRVYSASSPLADMRDNLLFGQHELQQTTAAADSTHDSGSHHTLK